MLGLSLKELAVFFAGTATGGIGVGLAIMGAIATVNQLAPPEHRGETLSTFFVAAYLGLSIPAIGVGIASQHVGFFRSTLDGSPPALRGSGPGQPGRLGWLRADQHRRARPPRVRRQ